MSTRPKRPTSVCSVGSLTSPKDAIEELVERGEVEAAAQRLVDGGRVGDAVQLLERHWNFGAAAGIALDAGDVVAALRNLLRAEAWKEAAELVDGLEADLACCAEVCEQRDAFGLAARLRERMGELERASALYERAFEFAEAARLAVTLRRPRSAVALYLRQIEHDGVDDVARSADTRMSLARLLLRHGRTLEAIPWLQQLARHPGPRGREAAIACIGALRRAGYGHAAEAAREIAARQHRDLPAVDACAADERFAPLEDDAEQVVLAGRYRLDALVGSGGMSRVYRAIDLVEGRTVAVKVFSAAGGTRGRDALRRFMREATVTGNLDHPHIVSCIDFSSDGFMVLEYMHGGSLAARLPPALPASTCRSIGLQVLSGLAAAHQHGVVHRDIKPSNIFFSEAGAAKIGDFGSAHLQDQGQTQTGAFIGTLAFMAPEQITSGDVTFATDIYGFGVTLFVMLTGSYPFEPPKLLDKHLHAPPPAPSSLVAGLPPICDEVVQKCMAKLPHERYRSLDALRIALQQFPRDVVTPAPTSVSPDPGAAQPVAPRYGAEGRARRVGALDISAARDTQLDRPVMLVRTPPPDLVPEVWQLLQAAARGDEHLQRVLDLNPEIGEALLAAPYEPFEELSAADIEPLEACRQLALAVSPLHEAGIAHGAITTAAVRCVGSTVVLSLVASLERVALAKPGDARAQIATDLEAIANLTALSLPPNLKGGSELASWAEAKARAAAVARAEARLRDDLANARADAPLTSPDP